MPDFPITDAHVHLYDPGKLSYPWLASVPKINRKFDLADFDKARGPVEVEAIVFAEVAIAPGQHLSEAAWVQSLADQDPRIQGIIAHAPLEQGPEAVATDLEKLKQNRCLKGIRRLIETEMDPRFCLEPAFLDALRLLPEHNLTFDICVKHWYLAFALELARRCPDVTFILDHIGKPGIKHAMQEPWKTQIKELASLPNTHCKVSGVITEADHSNWTKEQVKPYLHHVLDCFGTDRTFYGSDWTVSELTHPYPTWVQILDETLAGMSPDEQQRFWRTNARKVYRLDG